MAYRRDEETHEIEGRIELTTAKSRLVHDNMSGNKYFIPKSCTLDFNQSDADGNFLFVVSDWWWKKRHDFEATD